MSMRIVFLETYESHEPGKDYFIERTLAQRLCEKGVAQPYMVYHKERVEEATKLAQRAAAAAEATLKAESKKKTAPKKKPIKRLPAKRTKKIEKAVTIEK